MSSFSYSLAVAVLAAMQLRADVTGCACDVNKPETLTARECSLCREAEKQAPEVEFFLLHDVNPRKPNRWLALPRAHEAGSHPFHQMPKAMRSRLWKYAVAQAQAKFGDEWGLAYNGEKVRTQCHLHLHIGRWIKAADTSRFKFVRRVEDLPAPSDSGVLVRPGRGGYLVLTGEQIMETALVR